jgi:hypothetical protein
MMKLRVAVPLLLVLAGSRAAPQSPADVLQLNRQKIDTQRRVIVGGTMVLSDEEARAFWPLFEQYQQERQKLDTRADRLVADYVTAYSTLTDPRAATLLNEMLGIDDEYLKLRRRWIERVGKVLPPRKVVRYFQLENKLDAVVRAEMAQQIPLAP